MTPRKARKPREAEVSAVVIAFPVVARRDPGIGAKLPFTVIPVHPSEHVSSRAAPKAANQNDRPALPPPPRSRFWEAAIAFSLIAHTALFAAMWERNNYDLERAAGAAAAASDGAVVIPIEVIVTAALPSAPTPVEATTPEEKQVAPSVPQEQQDTEKTEKADAAPPPKSDEAPEVVQEAKETKETPKPEKEKRKEKKHSAPTPRTAAANPSQAAGAHAQGRAGAGGRRNDAGGNANTSSYQAQVLAHLQRYKSYPAAAKSAGIRGVATVRFALSASGAVISASLARGSGASVLDQAAVAMVRRASPFPPIPSGLGRSQMAFSAPIRFDLR
ncbi:MAG TPA: energy transducer TonB [Xanthobacteraceae bacterium]|jgi:protein TonB|nr:energy transducer TonB [Xanthobacteraceae bacterium]